MESCAHINRLSVIRNQLKSRKLVYDAVIRNNLDELRQKATVNNLELRSFIFGRTLNLRERVLRFLMNDKEARNWPVFKSLDEERYKVAMLLKRVGQEFKITWEEYQQDPSYGMVISDGLMAVDQSLAVKFGVHFHLYLKTLVGMGTSRHQMYINSALAFEDLGCFALTELGHGSNVKGIQTTAHYDVKTREFILDTPSDLAMKFWIGGAAQTANMSVVWAQLYVGDKCYGVHAFVVPIRNKRDHSVLPGIIIGDIGPKIGLNGADNGFMMFKKLRVPRENLLNKFSGVSEEGEFTTVIKNPDKRFALALGSLSGGRLTTAGGALCRLRNFLATGVRFAAIRTQFSSPMVQEPQPELAIIEYPLVQYRMFTNLAGVIAYSAAHGEVQYFWDTIQVAVFDKKSQLLPEFHALSSALKVFTTWYSYKGLNEVRQLLGGLGYSSYSKLGTAIHDADVTITFEGENTVLIQQTSKYLLDTLRGAMSGKVPTANSMKFLLADRSAVAALTCPKELKTIADLTQVLEFAANASIHNTIKQFTQNLAKAHGDMYNAWNDTQVFFANAAAYAYFHVFVAHAFASNIESVGDKPTKAVLTKLFELWALNTIVEQISVYAEWSYFTTAQIQEMKSRTIELCRELKPESVSIVDAISDPDELVGSVFGAADGDIYNKFVQKLWAAPETFSKPTWWRELQVHN